MLDHLIYLFSENKIICSNIFIVLKIGGRRLDEMSCTIMARSRTQSSAFSVILSPCCTNSEVLYQFLAPPEVRCEGTLLRIRPQTLVTLVRSLARVDALVLLQVVAQLKSLATVGTAERSVFIR